MFKREVDRLPRQEEKGACSTRDWPNQGVRKQSTLIQFKALPWECMLCTYSTPYPGIAVKTLGELSCAELME